MNLNLIRNLSEKYDGGLKKLASDIGMSEANLHRCINNNKIQASDLENIAIKLGVDISIFFDEIVVNHDNSGTHKIQSGDNKELLHLCKLLIANFQQRDKVVSQLVSMVKRME
ncbi:MAG: XRE family transcriptional regulator [Prevotella sp.]|nr:XRE family transcriptional regulator [Prevotella sp.]